MTKFLVPLITLALLVLCGCTVAMFGSSIHTVDKDSHAVSIPDSTNSHAHTFDVNFSPR